MENAYEDLRDMKNNNFRSFEGVSGKFKFMSLSFCPSGFMRVLAVRRLEENENGVGHITYYNSVVHGLASGSCYVAWYEGVEAEGPRVSANMEKMLYKLSLCHWHFN